jgi:uncharacterized protein (TIGR02145 family)
MLMMLISLISCENNVKRPYVGRTSVSAITTSGAYVSGRMIWDGGTPIKEYGFCWSTGIFPTLYDSYLTAEQDGDVVSARIEDLKEGTKYFIRMYAKNREGVSYGETKSFTTLAFKVPSVYSPYVVHVTHNNITLSDGRVEEDNTYDVFSKGICWSKSENPTINDTKLDLGSGFGSINGVITGLEPSTVYYFRAYASNTVGITYGDNLVPRTFDGSVTDYEGHVYSTVGIGNQVWMNRNLETRYYSNGEWIGTTGTQTASIESEDKPSYQWAYQGHEDHPEHLDDEGRLYTWYAVTDSRKLCPAGWHIPTIAEWNELLAHLGGNALTSEALRRCFNFNWGFWSSRYPGINEGSFWAQLVGFRNPAGDFQYGSRYGTYWWSSTEESALNAETVFLGPSDIDVVTTFPKNKKIGLSVRCVRD